MPADAAKLIGEQLMNVVKTSDGKKGLGLLLALALALFGARNGAGAIITSLNIAYDEHEKRGFVRLNLLALAMTAAAVLVAVLAMVAVAALGHLETLLPTLPGWVTVVGKIVTYVVLALAGAAGAATLYRFGPSRDQAGWVWLTPGSGFAAIGWLLLTIGFGVYVAHFGNYNATYGSLGAVVVLLTWLYLSCCILIFGAELIGLDQQDRSSCESARARKSAHLGSVATLATYTGCFRKAAVPHDPTFKPTAIPANVRPRDDAAWRQALSLVHGSGRAAARREPRQDTLDQCCRQVRSAVVSTAPTEPISVRIKEACRITGIGRSKLYELIAAGEIRTVKVGSMTLIPISGLRAFVSRHEVI